MPNGQSGKNLRADTVIVGGGVIGLSIARELRLRGVRDVVLLERGELGKEASWAAGGILAPQVEACRADEFFQLTRASCDSYPEFAESLRAETGIDVELDKRGTIYAGFTEEDERELRRRFEWQKREGLSIEWLDRDAARRIEPNISDRVRCALRFPGDYQVENRKLIEALVLANQRLAVRLITNCEVTSLKIHNEKVVGVESSAGFIDAPRVVIAAGAWASQIGFVGSPLESIAVEPVRGQMLCFQPATKIVQHVIYSSRGYLIPRRDGRLLAGSTSEQAGFEKRVTSEGIASIRSMASDIIPSIAELPLIDSWAGLRPRAPDGLPVLGPAEGVKGLFYATGHYRNGILLAPITAELMADAICDGRISPLLESFSVGRFSLWNA